jgi:murein DD-endopeptidase MepM/ murein hydrolase activator NlpD
MIYRNGARRGFRPASWALLLGFLLTACAPRVEAPAPVVGGEGAERGPERVTVQRGDTLSDIAHAHHIPLRVLAEANGLSPPYRIQVGRALMIPGAGQPGPRAPAAVAAVPPGRQEVAAAPATRPDSLASAPPDKPPIQAAPLPPVVSPAAEPGGSAPAPAAGRGEVQSTPAAPAAATPAPQRPAEPPAASSAGAPAARGSGAFLWPVRGRILASYGSRGDGTHNDGINIGAPRGASVQAVDAGVVAYTGNELRGYGNLILIKHSNGWISAYAHCDQLLVKRGEKVTRGQVIARVGSTGNVSEPQLHFELRHGHQPVDPSEFLTPLPAAAAKQSPSG